MSFKTLIWRQNYVKCPIAIFVCFIFKSWAFVKLYQLSSYGSRTKSTRVTIWTSSLFWPTAIPHSHFLKLHTSHDITNTTAWNTCLFLSIMLTALWKYVALPTASLCEIWNSPGLEKMNKICICQQDQQQRNAAICAQHPQGMNDGYWMDKQNQTL